ncbi:MAG: UdgX family uracil-DNA binding protein [Povalibacter sp.]
MAQIQTRGRLVEAPPVRISRKSLRSVREDAKLCRDCPLWRDATQTVFGEGRAHASVMLVGEQPGDQEDLTGKPFVGPAGKILDKALTELAVDRSAVYITNAVKHFKFEMRGKRRLHKKPADVEIAACHQWLEREIALIQPTLIVAMGATAARSIFGRATAIERNRGHVIERQTSGAAADILVTIHPSFLLRMPPQDKPAAFKRFVDDLRLALPYLNSA